MWDLVGFLDLLTSLLGAEWLVARGFGSGDGLGCPSSTDKAAVGNLSPPLLAGVRRRMDQLIGALLAMLLWADWATAKSQLGFPFPKGKAGIPFFSSSHPHSSVSLYLSLCLPLSLFLLPFPPFIYFCWQFRIAGLSSSSQGCIRKNKITQGTQ